MLSVLQEAQTSNNEGNHGSIQVTLPNNVANGSALHAFATGLGNITFTFSDGVNTWTTLDTQYNSDQGDSAAHGYAPNCASGSTTITVTFSSSISQVGIWVREIGGAAINPLDGHASAQAATGTTSISVSPSNSNQPSIISALVYDCNSVSGETLSATTGTADISGWTGLVDGTTPGLSSHEILSSTGTQNVGSSVTGNSVCKLMAFAAIFDAPSVAGATTWLWT
jgi:hypothetical protein